jgi:RimJ/RimL family protein N-acetyltransferase
MKETPGGSANPPGDVRLRPAEPQDEPFLLRVYAAARAQELAPVPWDDAQKQAFLEMQFSAQQQHYRTHYPEAEHQIICRGERPVGRLYLNRGPVEFRILDIAVLPESRKSGIGTLIIRKILDGAFAAGLPVTVYVESFNPSLHFFEQLGFRRKKQDDFNWLMQWDPEDTPANAALDSLPHETDGDPPH